jgi:tetratricopeptide (TPR) repeat protein
LNEALNVYASGPYDTSKIAMSLALTNKALDLDDQNVSALNHKTTLLFAKRDIDELLLTVNALISLRPEKPYYLGQKALYLEINGNSSEAREYYDSALNKYERYVKSDSLNFNLLLEYVQILVFAGNTSLADESLEKMTRMNFDDDQIKMGGARHERVVRPRAKQKRRAADQAEQGSVREPADAGESDETDVISLDRVVQRRGVA